MRKHFFLILTALALAACERTAAPSGEALLADGKPVDPLCFAPYLLGAGQEDDIALTGCGAGYVADNTHYAGIEGYIGTGFTDAADPDARGMRPAFIAYRVVGPVAGGATAITLTGSGGGTGVFSTLFTARQEGDVLKIEDFYAGGDRCNGGLTGAAVADGTLTYDVNITPYDFLMLGGAGEPAGIAAYDDMDACAACCMGTARYEGREFTGVQVEGHFDANARPPEQTVQICFDTIMAGREGSFLTATDYTPLRDMIRKECAK